jgi:SOS response regulatory protein OraA/RecX
MTTTLTKDITLHSAIAYLSLEREMYRKDIQEYLWGTIFKKEIETRVEDYLKEINIYDDQYRLTSYGATVRETGTVRTRGRKISNLVYTG